MIEFDFSYRKLNVYQLSKILVTDIYKMVKRFPLTETYALSDQMRRAVVSISSNIAEGTSKASPKEQFHFLESQALIQLKREYCDKKDCLRCRFGYEYLKRRV